MQAHQDHICVASTTHLFIFNRAVAFSRSFLRTVQIRAQHSFTTFTIRFFFFFTIDHRKYNKNRAIQKINWWKSDAVANEKQKKKRKTKKKVSSILITCCDMFFCVFHHSPISHILILFCQSISFHFASTFFILFHILTNWQLNGWNTLQTVLCNVNVQCAVCATTSFRI